MRRQKLARHLVLNGIAFAIVLIISFYPVVLITVVWELASVRSHWIATLARASYGGAVIAVGVFAWKKQNVKLAILFLGMLGTAAGAFALVHWW